MGMQILALVLAVVIGQVTGRPQPGHVACVSASAWYEHQDSVAAGRQARILSLAKKVPYAGRVRHPVCFETRHKGVPPLKVEIVPPDLVRLAYVIEGDTIWYYSDPGIMGEG